MKSQGTIFPNSSWRKSLLCSPYTKYRMLTLLVRECMYILNRERGRWRRRCWNHSLSPRRRNKPQGDETGSLLVNPWRYFPFVIIRLVPLMNSFYRILSNVLKLSWEVMYKSWIIMTTEEKLFGLTLLGQIFLWGL